MQGVEYSPTRELVTYGTAEETSAVVSATALRLTSNNRQGTDLMRCDFAEDGC